MTLPTCPSELPVNISSMVSELGRMWANSGLSPQIKEETQVAWAKLLHDWIDDRDLPLLVRKSSLVRGKEISHSTGRKIVPCDNAPAQWACNLALQGKMPSLSELKKDFMEDKIPVSFAHKANERGHRKYHCTLGKYSVNKAGWKLCHIKSVGLNSRTPLENVDVAELEQAFFDLLNPANYFLLPIQWGGIGEVQEFIEGFSSTTEGRRLLQGII